MKLLVLASILPSCFIIDNFSLWNRTLFCFKNFSVAEQNNFGQLWQKTAHQLGTPLSSMMVDLIKKKNLYQLRK